MKILYIGDICGEEALSVLEKNLDSIRKEYQVNVVLANAENTTSGKGLSKNHYIRLMKCGIQGMSMGNHTYSKSEINDYIEDANICRPANLHGAKGKEYLTIKYNDKTITIVNLLGRVFMNTSLDCPFQTMDRLLKEINTDYLIVDFHGEATSEKIAFMQDFRGKVDAVLGTHTHVPTADEKNVDGTLYISDIGMTGPIDSVIGDDKDGIITRFRTGVYTPCNVAKGRIEFNAVLLDFQVNSRKIIRIHKEF